MNRYGVCFIVGLIGSRSIRSESTAILERLRDVETRPEEPVAMVAANSVMEEFRRVVSASGPVGEPDDLGFSSYTA